MSFEFYATIPKLPPISVNDIVDALILHGLCLLNKFENNEAFLSWADQKKDENWTYSIRIWIEMHEVKISLNGSSKQIEMLIWILESFLSDIYSTPIVFGDL